MTPSPGSIGITACDVAIVGAGVAGLAAMRLLEERGLSTCVIEARARIGGRIMTVRDSRLSHPIELGAEFVHGSAPQLVDLLDDARLVAYVIEGHRWAMRRGRLTRLDDYWQRLHTVMRHLESVKRDQSFAEFIRSRPGGRRAAEARQLASSFVEGFYAADLEKISSKALADGGSPSEDPEEQRMMRISDGYDRVPAWLAHGLDDRVTQAAKRLARPIEGTIWLAGEGADSEGRNGTVNGAIGSGRSAAQSLLESRGSRTAQSLND